MNIISRAMQSFIKVHAFIYLITNFSHDDDRDIQINECGWMMNAVSTI